MLNAELGNRNWELGVGSWEIGIGKGRNVILSPSASSGQALSKNP